MPANVPFRSLWLTFKLISCSINGNVYDDYARLLDDKWKENFELVKELGWTEMSDDIYEKLLQDTENAMKADGIDEAKITSEIDKAR